ncbi:MAG: hypothetical protein C0423_15770 [Methylibium sp.]|nr:hypothetical protein [Methylibium sp.]
MTIKWTGRLLLALLLLALAWLAFNNRWVDAAPAPVPEALRLPEPGLPPAANGFFALIGLDAAEGVDPSAEGLRRWNAPHEPLAAGRLRWPGRDGRASPAWTCSAERQDCVEHWRRESSALMELLPVHATLGARCERLAAPGLVIEELLPQPRSELRVLSDQYVAQPPAPHALNATDCLRWLRMRAVLAEQSGDVASMLAHLQGADVLVNALLRGSRSLIAASVAWTAAGAQARLVTMMASARPARLPELAALLPPLPAEARNPGRWIAAEAFFQRQVIRELGLGCSPERVQADVTLDTRLQCSPMLAFLPNATQHLLDEQWQRGLTQARGDVLNLLDWQPPASGQRVLGMAWRNSIGHWLVDTAWPAYEVHAYRQANFLLQHEAARLALAAAGQAPPQRATWLAARKDIDPRLLARLQFDGDDLVASGWSASGDEPRSHRYPIPTRPET